MSARPVWLIGCGNMAGAMLDGWLLAGEAPDRFHVIDPGEPELPVGVVYHENPPGNGFGDAIVQMGFKPHMLGDIGPGLAPGIGADTVVTSIMAGVEIASLRRAFPDAGAIVRVMPNMPVGLGRGAVGLVAEDPAGEQAKAVRALLDPLGQVESLDSEDQLNAVTVLSGSGPAFLFRFIDALAKGGEAIGLDAAQSLRLAMATVDGAAGLAVQSGDDPGALAERVASPGGTTRAGLDVLDADHALLTLIEKTLKTAKARAEEMAAEAR